MDKLRSGEPLTAKERVIHEHGLVSVLRQLHDEIDAAVLEACGWSDLAALLRVAHGLDAGTPRAQHAQERPHGNDAPLPSRASNQHADPAVVGTSTAATLSCEVANESPSIAADAAPAGCCTGGTTVSPDVTEAQRAFDQATLERLVALNAEPAAEEARDLIRWLRPEFRHPTAQEVPIQPNWPPAGPTMRTSCPRPRPNPCCGPKTPWPRCAPWLTRSPSAPSRWDRPVRQPLHRTRPVEKTAAATRQADGAGRPGEQDGRYTSH
jgi:hypothetical protein